MKKLPLILALMFVSVFAVGCGEEELTAQQKEEIICGKMVMKYGAQHCAPGPAPAAAQ